MSDRARRKELRKAGIAAARDARAVLARAIALLDDEVASTELGRAIAQRVTVAVAALYRAEIGEPEVVRDRLVEAASVLGDALGALHAPGASVLLEQAGPLVARSLAVIHPARAELERALREVPPSQAPPVSRSPEAPTAPPMVRRAPSGSERRSAPRVRIEGAIGAQSGATFIAGEASDLSSGGLFVETVEPLPIGTELTLGLLLPDGHRVVVDAVVSWVRGGREGRGEGMGVRFVRISHEDAAAIARHAE